MVAIQIQLIFFLTLFHLSLQFAHREMHEKTGELDIRSMNNPSNLDVLENKKRPFCNAFTGCGRKRSDLPPRNPQSQDDSLDLPDDSIGSLLDLNSEPAVADLVRQIMSEAKLWEAIQEANREISYQNPGKQRKGHFNIAFNSQ